MPASFVPPSFVAVAALALALAVLVRAVAVPCVWRRPRLPPVRSRPPAARASVVTLSRRACRWNNLSLSLQWELLKAKPGQIFYTQNVSTECRLPIKHAPIAWYLHYYYYVFDYLVDEARHPGA